MKNLKKIMFAAAILMLIGIFCSIMAFAEDSTQPFSVDGKEYSSFADALNAADADSPIVLHADFDTGYSGASINKTVTIDLNGYTITGVEKNASNSYAYNFFTILAQGNLTITGHGTIDVRRSAINLYRAGAVANIIGTGKGITIKQSVIPAAPTIKVYDGAVLNLTGKIIFEEKGSSSTGAILLNDANCKLNIENADITYVPSAAFLTVNSGTVTEVKNSKIYVEKANYLFDGSTGTANPATCNLTNTDITYGNAATSSCYLFVDAIYSVVDGCSINLNSASFAQNTYTYSDTAKIGILIKKGTVLSKAVTCSTTTPATKVTSGGFTLDTGCSWKPYFSKDHNIHYTLALNSECGVNVYRHFNFSSATPNYSYSAPDSTSEPEPSALGGLNVIINQRWGRLNIRQTVDGNKYLTYTATATATTGSLANTPYFFFNLGNLTSSGTTVENSMSDTDYYVYDVDIMSETGTYPSVLFKTLLYHKNASGERERPQPASFNIKTNNLTKSSYITFNEEKIDLTSEPYLWHHITYIVAIAEVRSESKIYVYVDGNLLGVAENALPVALDDPSNYYNSDTKYATVGEIRIEESYSADEKASFAIDNLTVRTFSKGYTGNAETGISAFLKNPTRSLTECSDSIFTADYDFPFTNHIASVNGTPYDNFDDAFNAAIKEQDSTLTLMSNVTLSQTLRISDGARITLDLNGNTILTESMTDKLHSFSIGKNATLNVMSSEPGGKIFNVSYADGVTFGAAIFECAPDNATLNIDGSYLSTYSAGLIDTSTLASATAKITINGGHYYATVNNPLAYIINRNASAKISVSNATFALPSGAYLYTTDSNYVSGSSNVTFNGCTVLAQTTSTALINQIDSQSTVSFLDCKLYGSLIPATKANAGYNHGSIIIDENTLFAGVPEYDGTAFSIPSGYKFAGVDGEMLNLTLYYNSFAQIDGKTSDDSLVTEALTEIINFQTALVTESTKTALVNWLDPNGSLLYSEEFSVGSTASFRGKLPIFNSGNDWYNYTATSWKGGTKITQADKTYSFSPVLTPAAKQISALQSITLYTGFDIHLYLPAPTHTVSNVVVTDEKGVIINESGRELVNGVAYCIYTISVKATDLAKDHAFNISFTVTDADKGIEATELSTQLKLNVSEYAKALLEGNYSKSTKSLAADMLRYAYECHKMANNTTISLYSELMKKYSEYLSDIPERFGYAREYSYLATYISSVHFRLGSEADYVFTTTGNFIEGMKLKLEWRSVTGETVIKTFSYNPETNEHSTEGMKVFDVTAVMRITIENSDGNVLALGYYSLATYINAMQGSPNTEFAKALFLFSSSAQKYRFPLASQDSVSYSDFGAVGDGVTDDFFAILSTHEFANLNGLKVKADAGKTYYIGDNGKCTINVTTDTDWTGAKFIIDDSDVAIKSPAMSSPIFNLSSDSPTVTYTEKSEGTAGSVIAAINAAGGFKKNEITHLDLGLGKKALLCIINNTTAHYIRFGPNEDKGSAQREVILVDENGKIDESTPFMFDYSKITSIEVYSASDEAITVTGGEITSVVKVIDVTAPENENFVMDGTYNNKTYTLLKNYTSYSRGIIVSRSNSTIRGLKHYVDDRGNYGPAYSAFLMAQGTNNVLFEGCTVTGHKTYYCWGSNAAKSYVPMGSYDISANTSNNVTWKNCVQTNFFHPKNPSKVSTDIVSGEKYWGIMGSNYSKNLTYDGSKLTRFDAHCGVYNATIINSEVTIASIIGGGTFRLENSKMYSNSDAYYLLYLREDYGSTFEGDIIVKDVEWIAERNLSEYAIMYAVYTNWNFGYTCHLPTNILVDNLTVSTSDGTKTGSDITLTLFKSSYLSNDYSADEYNGADNINKIVVPKSYKVLNNNAGHIYRDPTSEKLFASVPEGYFSYTYTFTVKLDTPVAKVSAKDSTSD